MISNYNIVELLDLFKSIAAVSGITIVPILTWFFTKRKFQKKELQSKDMDIIQKQIGVISDNLDIYERMLKFSKVFQTEQIQKRDEEIEKLSTEIEKLVEENLELDSFNEEFRDNIRELKNRVYRLQIDLDECRG